MDLRRLLLKIDADVNGAILGLGKVNKQLDTTEEKLDAVDKKAKDTDLVREFSKWSSAFYRLVGLFQMGGAQIKQAFQMASEGAKISAAQSFFENAGRSIEDLRKATSGMISDAELMKKANLADSMGISIDTFKTLAQVAQASAFKTGQSFDYMFESIIVGTARSSRLLLDNLGIIVSVKEANENYARTQLKLQGIQNATNAQINAYVETMDDNAKKTAFAEEVQRKSADTLSEMGRALTSTAAKYEGLGAATSNLSDTIKKAMAEAGVDTADFFTKFTIAIDRAIKRVGLLKGLFSGAGILGSFLVGKSPEDMLKEVDNTLNAFDRKEKAYATEFLQSHLEQLAEKLGTQDIGKAVLAVSEYMATGKALNSAVEQQIKQIVELNRLAGGFIVGVKKPTAGEAITPSKGGSLAKKVKEDIGDEARDLIKGFGSHMEAYFDDLDKFKKWLDSVEPSFEDLRRETKRLEEAEASAALNLKDLALELVQPISDAVGDAVGAVARGQGLFGPLMSTVDTLSKDQGGISGIISSSLSSAGMGATAAGPLGAAIGAIIPVIMEMLDQLKPVSAVIQAITDGLRLFTQVGLGEFVRMLEPLGPSITLLLTALGLFVSSILRPFSSLLTFITSTLSFVITLFAGLIAVLAPIQEAITQIIMALASGFLSIIPLFFDLNDALDFMINAAKDFSAWMITAIIDINNAIVKFARETLGLEGFGKKLKYEDFILATDDNTEAVKENTRAVRDLAREFRNMPSGYKVNRSIYEASDPEVKKQNLRSVRPNDLQEIFKSNPRWRV